MGERKAPRSGVIGGYKEVLVLKRAEHDLLALGASERAAVARAIDALSLQQAPRGALALTGRAEGHVQQRVGRLRVLYAVREESVVVVAVTRGAA